MPVGRIKFGPKSPVPVYNANAQSAIQHLTWALKDIAKAGNQNAAYHVRIDRPHHHRILSQHKCISCSDAVDQPRRGGGPSRDRAHLAFLCRCGFDGVKSSRWFGAPARSFSGIADGFERCSLATNSAVAGAM
jgi:hypothetical protein